jgi:FlaG/FlaF family flagellin (archaellin)
MMRKNKKGISGVIATILLIAISMAAVIIVWNVINNLLSEKLEETESCFNIFGKVSLNSRYTCYDTTSKSLRFSLNIGDIDVEKVIVSVSSAGDTTGYELTSTGGSPGLTKYGSAGDVKLPAKNGGSTYVTAQDSFAASPDSIQLTPVIQGKQCDTSDTLSEIDDCQALSP